MIFDEHEFIFLVDEIQNVDTLFLIISEVWEALHDQINARDQRLKAAEEIHRFHRDIADAMQRIQEKNATLGTDLGRDLNAALSLLRKHEAFENELVVLEAQLQVRNSIFHIKQF